MDDRSVVASRDLKRDFHVNRHSLSAIAKAFQLLCAEHSPAEPDDSSEQTAQDSSPQPQLQEAH
jgi:hypothetical protein